MNEDHPIPGTISFVQRLVEARPLSISPRFMRWLLSLGSIIFLIPRGFSGWFFVWAALVFALPMAAMLKLLKHVQTVLQRIHQHGHDLLESEEQRSQLDNWWSKLDGRAHFMMALLIGIALGAFSLIFNGNPGPSRYIEALGIAYLGFVIGEIAYLLALVPVWISQLSQLPLRLNPIDPASTTNLRTLAETVFGLALSAGAFLLLANALIVSAGVFFAHLAPAVIIVSVTAWIAIILLAGYPQLHFYRLVQSARRDTLHELEKQMARHYKAVLDGHSPQSPTIDDTLQLYNVVRESGSLPISGGAVVGVVVTLLLNVVPIFAELVIR